MSGDLAPKGFVRLSDAVVRLADLPKYTEDVDLWRDVGDWVDDAEVIAAATTQIREAGMDGRLRGFYFVGDGKAHTVPEGTWTEHAKCLSRAGTDLGFENIWFFHPDGLEIDGARYPVFLPEHELEEFIRGNTKPKATLLPTTKRKVGRRKGSTDAREKDEALLRLMAPLIETGDAVMTAADIVIKQYPELVWRNPKTNPPTSDDNVSSRLQKKWRERHRPNHD